MWHREIVGLRIGLHWGSLAAGIDIPLSDVRRLSIETLNHHWLTEIFTVDAAGHSKVTTIVNRLEGHGEVIVPVCRSSSPSTDRHSAWPGYWPAGRRTPVLRGAARPLRRWRAAPATKPGLFPADTFRSLPIAIGSRIERVLPHEAVDRRCATHHLFDIDGAGSTIPRAFAEAIGRPPEIVHRLVDVVFDPAAVNPWAIDRVIETDAEGSNARLHTAQENCYLLIAGPIGALLRRHMNKVIVMTNIRRRYVTNRIPLLASGLIVAGLVSGCTGEARTLEPQQIEQQYGVSGAYTGSVATPNGSMQGTIIPITLADGRRAQLVIPQRQASDVRSVYLLDNEGMHPVQLKENASRQEVSGAPAIVQRRSAPEQANRRSWEKEVLIIGGSAGAGTAIGALAGGKKGQPSVRRPVASAGWFTTSWRGTRNSSVVT
jgi:hypothetical protein